MVKCVTQQETRHRTMTCITAVGFWSGILRFVSTVMGVFREITAPSPFVFLVWTFCTSRLHQGRGKFMEKFFFFPPLGKERELRFPLGEASPSRRRCNWIDTLWLDEEINVRPLSHVLVPLPAVIFQQPGIRDGSLPVRTLHHSHERLHSPQWLRPRRRRPLPEQRAPTRTEALEGYLRSDPMNAWPRRPLIMGCVHSAGCESLGQVLICLLTAKRAMTTVLWAKWTMAVFRAYWKTEGCSHSPVFRRPGEECPAMRALVKVPLAGFTLRLWQQEIINRLPVKK